MYHTIQAVNSWHWAIRYPSCVNAPVSLGNMTLLTLFLQGNYVVGFFLDIETDVLLKESNLGQGPGERGFSGPYTFANNV